MRTTWCHVAVLACLSIKWLASQALAESIICDSPELCAITQRYFAEDSPPEKRFLRFGRAMEPDENDLLKALVLLQSDEPLYRKRRSTDTKVMSKTSPHRVRRSAREETVGATSGSEVGPEKEVEKRDVDGLLEAKRFMRFGRGSDDDVEKRFMRFGKRFMRFGRDPDKRFMRFGREPDKRFMRFGRDPDKRFMRFGRSPVDKRFMRFGRSYDDEKRFMRFGRGASLESLGSEGEEAFEEEPQDEFGAELDKRFMRFGKRFMRFGKRDDENESVEKRFMRFGRNDGEEPEKRFMRFGKRFMRFGKSLDNDDVDKRFMRFGKRFMRFGKRDTSSVENNSASSNT